MKTQTKITLSIAYLVSLLPAMLPQYGGMRGVQEISGCINLFHPIGLISVALFYIGLWVPVKNDFARKAVSLAGCLGMVVSEIYHFLTWHILTITGKFSLAASFRLAYPEFYVGLVFSVIMTALYLYFAFFQKQREN